MAGSKDKHWLTIGDVISIILDGLSLSSLLYFVIPYIVGKEISNSGM